MTDKIDATIEITQQIINAPISIGTRGLSAYEIAVQEGFIGTQSEWNTQVAEAVTAAELAQTGAEAALAAVEILYDDFDDAYLGAFTADPTVDNDGDPLDIGAIYYYTAITPIDPKYP